MNSDKDNAKRKRAWQFSLRDMLAITLITALAVGWWLDHQSQVAALSSAQEEHEETKERLQEAMQLRILQPLNLQPLDLQPLELRPRLRYESPLPSAAEWNSGQSPLGPTK